ncbi:MAG: ABC transporter permease [Pirellulales bacterium]|nr:ABC transporter permease [Pirellulales bacterium]
MSEITANTDTQSARRSTWELVWSVLGPFVGLGIVLAIFLGYQLIEQPPQPFLSKLRMTMIAKQTAIVGIGALGMTVIIISGGIDLSAGSILALTAVLLAMLLKQGVEPILALIAIVLAGIACGVFNGLLIVTLRLIPFIVTLGTMLALRGVAERVSDQQKIQAPAPEWMSTLLDPPASGSWQLVCTGVWIVLGLGLVLAAVLRLTVFGRYVFAIGSNEATARLCGINVPLVKIAVYALGGAFMALAGLFDFNDLAKQGNPTSGLGKELEIIAAVVIGGGSLNGGRGSVLGSILGALTMTTLSSGCVYAGVSDPVQKIVIGLIIIAAVAVDQFLHRRSD